MKDGEEENNINKIQKEKNDENENEENKKENEGKEDVKEERKNKYETANVLNKRLQKLKRNLPFLCTILYVAGVASIVFYVTNMFANVTYVSENALLPSFSELQYSEEYSLKAQRRTYEYLDYLRQYQIKNNSLQARKEKGLSGSEEELPSMSEYIADWVEGKLRDIRLSNVYQHKFLSSDGREGINTVGILKAARASGREAIVITSRTLHPLFSRKVDGAVSSLCLSFSLLEYFQQVKWLSKDIIFVATDSVFGDESIKLWLERYHSFYTKEDFIMHENITYTLKKKDLFYRGGEIRGALALDFYSHSFSHLVVVPEGVNGKLPNLDLINAIDRVAGFSENIQTNLRDRFDPLTTFLYSKNSPISMQDLPPPLANMFIFILHCAIGTPTGDHSWFHLYNIDAVTLKVSSDNAGQGSIPIFKFGRVVEGTVRCLSNLVEHFHQSFYFYILAGMTFRYVSIGQYLISTGLILSPLLGYLFHTMFLSEVNQPYCYLRALCRTFIFQIAGALCFVLFPAFNYLPVCVCIILALVAWGASKTVKRMDRSMREYIYGEDDNKRPPVEIILHTSFYPLLFFLTTFSLLNWSFCVIASSLVIPLFLLLQPSDRSPLRNRLCSLSMLLLSLPLLLFYSLFFFPHLSSSDILSWIHLNYSLYSSLLYPFLCLVYIPLNLSHFITSFTRH